MSSLKARDDRDGPGPAEITMMVLSVAITLGLFIIVGYQAATGPAGPELAVDSERTVMSEGDIEVHVLVRNAGGTGVSSVTIEVPCDNPPPSLEFTHLPADGQRQGVIVCPAGAEDLAPEISAWEKV